MIVEPLTRPPDATVRIPGSKSVTNRALLAAAMADGTSTLTGALVADDTQAMVDAARALGATVACDDTTWTVTGTAGVPPAHEVSIDARQTLHKTHAVAEILDLYQRKELTTRLAFAVAKAAVIDRQHDVARPREELALVDQ